MKISEFIWEQPNINSRAWAALTHYKTLYGDIDVRKVNYKKLRKIRNVGSGTIDNIKDCIKWFPFEKYER